MRYKGDTGTTTTIKLASSIDSIKWKRRLVAPGARVGLEICTRFVGNGAEVEIRLSDHQGQSHGNFKDKLHADRFTGEIAVPPGATGALYADVKLPKHGLSLKSPALLLTPPIEIDNSEWSAETARRGDVMMMTAGVTGAPDGTEAAIHVWERDQDGIKHPITRLLTMVDGGKVRAEWEFDYPDPVETIPAADESGGYHKPEFVFTVDVLGVQSESSPLTFHDWIEIRERDSLGRPASGGDFSLSLPDGSARTGALDVDGHSRLEDGPPGPYRMERHPKKSS